MDSRDLFIEGYIDCAYWAEDEQQAEDGSYYHLSTFENAPDTLATLRQQAGDWYDANSDVIAALVDAEKGPRGWEHAGHDFWLTRNGYGCGFWDSDRWVNTDAAMKLNTASKTVGPSLLYLGDDDLVYVYPSVASK